MGSPQQDFLLLLLPNTQKNKDKLIQVACDLLRPTGHLPFFFSE